MTKPYRIYHGDSLDILPTLPEESVDLIFADPPYFLSNDGFTCHAGKKVSVNKGVWDKSQGVEKDFEFHEKWIRECARVLKPSGSFWVSGTYHSIFACGYALQRQGWHIINDISWFKPNASPNLSCRMFTASHETLIWARKDKKHPHTFNYNVACDYEWAEDQIKVSGKQMRSVWSIRTPKPEEKLHGKHPTQKALKLLERIILTTSNEKDIVLDPFSGSATTGVAAVRHNRRFIGIEIEDLYIKKFAIPRMEDEIGAINSRASLKKRAVYG